MSGASTTRLDHHRTAPRQRTQLRAKSPISTRHLSPQVQPPMNRTRILARAASGQIIDRSSCQMTASSRSITWSPQASQMSPSQTGISPGFSPPAARGSRSRDASEGGLPAERAPAGDGDGAVRPSRDRHGRPQDGEAAGAARAGGALDGGVAGAGDVLGNDQPGTDAALRSAAPGTGAPCWAPRCFVTAATLFVMTSRASREPPDSRGRECGPGRRSPGGHQFEQIRGIPVPANPRSRLGRSCGPVFAGRPPECRFARTENPRSGHHRAPRRGDGYEAVRLRQRGIRRHRGDEHRAGPFTQPPSPRPPPASSPGTQSRRALRPRLPDLET